MATITRHPTANTPTTGFNGVAANPANAYSSNDLYATFVSDATPRNDEYAHNFRGFDFSAIPTGSTITSVNVHVEHKVSSNWSQGNFRMSVWPDVTVAAALTAGTVGAIGPDLQYNHGVASGYLTDTDWNVPLTGTLPTVAQLKGANFGVRVQIAQGNNGGTFTTSIDDIYIVVNYNAPIVTQTGSFTANAAKKRTQTGSLTVSAAKKKTQTGAFFLDAAVNVVHAFDFSVDAVVKDSRSGSLSASAVIQRGWTGAVTADAWITLSQTTETGSFTADATALVASSGALVTDAIIEASRAGSFTADAVAQRAYEAAFTSDATLEKTLVGWLVADATVLATRPDTFPASAWIAGIFTVDAYLAGEAASFSADAVVGLVGPCVWVSPANMSGIGSTPTLVFLMPPAAGNMHFQIELDTDNGFPDPTVVQSPGTGWEYWDGDSWEPIPDSGVLGTFGGNEARYTVQSPLTQTTWYRRVRAGVIT